MAVIDVGGVAFKCFTSMNTLRHLPRLMEKATLYTHLNVREDALDLFGFTTQAELNCFKLLTAISGVGPKVALAALSTFSPHALADAIAAQDTALVSKIPGVGKKTASRIILELKGSLELEESLFDAQGAPALDDGARKGATEALLSMGFTSVEADLALKGAPDDATEAALLQYALKRLGNR